MSGIGAVAMAGATAKTAEAAPNIAKLKEQGSALNSLSDLEPQVMESTKEFVKNMNSMLIAMKPGDHSITPEMNALISTFLEKCATEGGLSESARTPAVDARSLGWAFMHSMQQNSTHPRLAPFLFTLWDEMQVAAIAVAPQNVDAPDLDVERREA